MLLLPRPTQEREEEIVSTDRDFIHVQIKIKPRERDLSRAAECEI